MKKIFHIAMLLLLMLGWTGAASALAQEQADSSFSVTGVVRDRATRKRLGNVSVTLAGTAVGTVTNEEGLFSLKFAGRPETARLELSHIGYRNTSFAVAGEENTSGETLTLWMSPVAQELDAIVIYADEARRLVEAALEKVPDNYPASESLMKAFYRETVRKGQRYIGISEAMMDVYKSSYEKRDIWNDRVQILKARRLLSQKQSDTLAVKIAGGPALAVNMDVVKNADMLFDTRTMDFYTFEQLPSVVIGDRTQYVVAFRPRVRLSFALFEGRVYIDSERLAFTRAEFSLDVSDRDKAADAILRKKPAGLRFRPIAVNFLVTYRLDDDGTSYLNYICNEMRFRCDWKRRLFSSSYTARSEMVVVDREEEVTPIARRDAFRPRQIFYDMVGEYWSADYWKDYNIIEPTESLENAVNRLRTQQ